MHLDDRAVHGNGLDLDADDLFVLQLLKHPVEHAPLGPSVHTGVDRMPVPEARGKPSPLADVLRHVQDRVEHHPVTQAHIASLRRKAFLNPLKLYFDNLHR